MYASYPIKYTVSESIKRFLQKQECKILCVSYDVKLYRAIDLVSLKINKKLHKT